eukprot:gene2288-1671_t
MSNHHQSEIVSLSTLLQSILFIPRTSNGFEATQRKRSTLVVEVIERLLRDAHSHNDASRILSALRDILDNNRQRESSTTSSSASNTAFLVHDLFIRLFQCAAYQNHTLAEDVAQYLLNIAALEDTAENVDNMEFLAQFVAVLIHTCIVDDAPIFFCQPPEILRSSQATTSSSSSSSSSVGSSRSSSAAFDGGVFHPTLFVRVTKMNASLEAGRPVLVLTATRLAASIVDTTDDAAAAASASFATRLTYTLLCVRIVLEAAAALGEEAFFPWICRPHDVYVPASDSDRLWASADASTSPAALLRIVTERAILQFCRHLLSTGQAMLFAQQQRQRSRPPAANGLGGGSGGGKKPTDGGAAAPPGSVPASQLTSYLQRYAALQATVHRLPQQVPPVLWLSTMQYALSVDPYASDKRLFKWLPPSSQEHPASVLLVDPVHDEEHDAIDRDVLMGPLQRREDYRVFVGCVVSTFAAAVAASREDEDEAKRRRFHRTCRWIRHCRQQPPEDFDTTATALPLHTQRLLAMVQRLQQPADDTTIAGDGDGDGDDAPVVEWLQLVQDATDTLVMTALLAVVDEALGVQPSSSAASSRPPVAVASAAHVAHVAQYRRVLWQLQRQWMTEYKGFEDLLDRWTLIAAHVEHEAAAEAVAAEEERHTWLDGLYASTWPRCVAWSLSTTTAATTVAMANRPSSSTDGVVSNDGPPPPPPAPCTTTISTLLELQTKEQQQQQCSSSATPSPPPVGGVTGTFHPAMVVRALWQRWFQATRRAEEEPAEAEEAVRATGITEAILGVHCL